MEQLMLRLAQDVARRGVCSRLQVGAIVCSADLSQIFSYGYNGPERGGPNHCRQPDVPGACGCLHAESNALNKDIPSGPDLAMVITCAPCFTCAQMIVNRRRIRTVYYRDNYRYTEGRRLLEDAGIQTTRVTPWDRW